MNGNEFYELKQNLLNDVELDNLSDQELSDLEDVINVYSRKIGSLVSYRHWCEVIRK